MHTLVAGGADPNIPSAAGTTALMVAAGLGYAGNFSQQMAESWIPAVQLCLDLGLDVNAADSQGYTALHGAAYRGDNELVKFLVSKGAKIDARNKRGWSVTDMANAPSLRSSVPLAHPETVALLLEMGAPPLTAIEGETILGSGRKGRGGAYGASGAKVSPEIAGYATWMKAVAAANTSLKKSVEEKQAAAISLDAQTLADVFGQVREYWTKSNATDAVALSKTAHDASLDLAAAAKAGNWEQAGVAMKAIGGTCSGCHTAHREKLPDGAYTIKK
jgi:ankyrin repeat protein